VNFDVTMKLSLSFADIIVILIYYLITAYIGFRIFRKHSKNKKIDKVSESDTEQITEYLLAGRELTLPFFVTSLVATWYGNILGIGEFVHRYGLVAWFCFGIVYYITAFFYALLISRKVRESPNQTIPEQISSKFGKPSGLLASFVMLIITFPSVYVLMVGVFINLFTGLELLYSIILGTFISFIYIAYGGFKSNVYTNFIQFIFMYFGFGVFTFFAFLEINFDLSKLNALPTSHLKFFGDVSWQYIATWVFISLQTFVDPSFYQRCASVSSGKIAKRGILISILFWIVFDSMTIFIGFVGKLKFPNIEPLLNYPMLLENLVPPFFKGIVFVAMLATILSTLESYSFLSALIIGKNIFGYFSFRRNLSTQSKIRIGLAISAIFSITIAYFIPSAIDIIYKTSSIAVPSLFYPTLLSFSKKEIINSKQANLIIFSSALVTLLFSIAKELSFTKLIEVNYPIKILTSFEPMVFGFLWSSILLGWILGYTKFIQGNKY